MNTARRLPGLEDTVTVHRDAWGIAHARARTTHDAFFAQGYLHAADRFWQMDAARLRMQGRWSEWVGEAGVEADTLARRLGVAAACRRDERVLGADARAMVEAYSAGVNAWLAQTPELPAEYAFLPTGRPEPWQPWHCIAAMRWRGYLMGSLWYKLWRAAALKIVGPEQVAKLRADDGGLDRLCIPPGADAERWIADLRALAPAIAALEPLAAADATGGGSNNWAVSGARTASGRPLLAGDPHRVFEMPGMYAQGHIACDAFDAIGLAVPGVPGFPHFAHNGHVAWGVTYAFADIHDLYVDRFAQRDGAVYSLFEGAYEPVRTRDETIRVRDGEDRDITVFETRHGPVIAGSVADGGALTLRSMQFEPTDHSFDCLPRMLTARSVEALFEATRGWGLVDHNLVAADTAGRIGHRVRALVPVRPRLNGWLPVPGWTGEYEWQGTVPFEDMPHAIDPPRGFIATANNRIVADRADGPYLCTDCHPPYRAQRIEHWLAQWPQARVEDMRRLHLDAHSPNAALFQALAERTDAPGPAAEGLRRQLLQWDGEVAADSVGAAAYQAFRWQLAAVLARRSGLDRAAGDAYLRLPPGVSPVLELWWALPSLLRADDTGLLDGWSWVRAAATALEAAVAQSGGLSWGEHHRAVLAHPLEALSAQARARLHVPGLPQAGDNDTVRAAGSVPGLGLAAAYGAVARYVFDVGDWDASGWVVVDGASGNADSPHRIDQHPVYSRGELVPMRYRWETIAAEAVKTERLSG